MSTELIDSVEKVKKMIYEQNINITNFKRSQKEIIQQKSTVANTNVSKKIQNKFGAYGRTTELENKQAEIIEFEKQKAKGKKIKINKKNIKLPQRVVTLMSLRFKLITEIT